ncbi:sugar transporter [Acidimangrovimonas pyrenivorans]|uniref:Sugar transporter n=1 Tax=Acidimangrovimonas pyrenivorans TaxID=2030798 RepID=A0ABV7ANA0_9RHOB
MPDRSESTEDTPAENGAAAGQGRPAGARPGPRSVPGAGKPGGGPNQNGPNQKMKPGARPGGKQGPGGAKPAPVVQIRPLSEPAKMKRRHWGLMLSFVLAVLLPLAATGVYLWALSSDQYASDVGFTVRKEDNSSSTASLIGGLAQFTGIGGGGGSDSDILYEYIQSPQIVENIDKKLDLRKLYSQHWPSDPLFSLWPSSNNEQLLWYWQRMVRISYDKSTGLIDLTVLAFTPEAAQKIAHEIVVESQAMINNLNITARHDALTYARQDLDEAVKRLKSAREAMTTFRTRTQIVDPSADIQGQMGVLNNLQQQLAAALINYDLLRDTASATDPRLSQAQRKIDVIRQRIATERKNFASDKVSTANEDYPTLMAQYESLNVDLQFAEETYRAALAAYDVARSNASRDTRYLASYVQPTLPDSSEYPQRYVLFGLTALFLMMIWAIAALIYYSIRDRR